MGVFIGRKPVSGGKKPGIFPFLTVEFVPMSHPISRISWAILIWTGLSYSCTKTDQVQPVTPQITITGTVISCKNAGLPAGKINLQLDRELYRANIKDGRFSITVQRKAANPAVAQLVAEDDAGTVKSEPMNLDVTEGQYDAGAILACQENNQQYVSYTINGTNTLLQAPADSLVIVTGNGDIPTTMFCYATNNPVRPRFQLAFSGSIQPGQYAISNLSIAQPSEEFSLSGKIMVEITDKGVPGGCLIGKSTGQLMSAASSQVVPFSFQFKILRKN
jgi:hypothetical protein